LIEGQAKNANFRLPTITEQLWEAAR